VKKSLLQKGQLGRFSNGCTKISFVFCREVTRKESNKRGKRGVSMPVIASRHLCHPSFIKQQRALDLILNSPCPSLNKEGDLLIASVSSLFDKEQQRALDLILNSPTPKLPNFKPPL
jgi:hypothetical protein